MQGCLKEEGKKNQLTKFIAVIRDVERLAKMVLDFTLLHTEYDAFYSDSTRKKIVYFLITFQESFWEIRFTW